MTPTQIFEYAPIGAIVTWSDNTPRPPDRFKNKRSAWETRNGQGQLIRKQQTRTSGNYSSPPSFVVHLSDLRGRNVVVARFLRAFSIDTDLTFTIVQRPLPGSVRIFDRPGEHAEFLHLATNRTEAEAWLQTHRYPQAVLDEVPRETTATDVSEGRAA